MNSTLCKSLPEKRLTKKEIFGLVSGIIAIPVLLALVWMGGTFVRAQNETDTVYIFPQTVESVGWQSPGAALSQELLPNADYGQFNWFNAAYVGLAETERSESINASNGDLVATSSTASSTAETPVATSTASSTSDTSDGSSNLDIAATTTISEISSTTPVESENDPMSDASTASSSSGDGAGEQGVPSSLEEDTASSSAPVSSFRAVSQTVAKAIKIISSAFSPSVAHAETATTTGDEAEDVVSTSTILDNLVSTTTRVVSEEIVPSATSSEHTEATSTISVNDANFVDNVATSTATTSPNTVEIPAATSTGAVSTSTHEGSAATTSATSTTFDSDNPATSTVATTTETSTTTTETSGEGSIPSELTEDLSVCEIAGTDCYLLTYQGFGLATGTPETLDINAVTLRMSFASFVRPPSDLVPDEEGESDSIVVRYRHQGVWHLAGEFSLEGMMANSDNGGYLSYPLPEFSSWDELGDLEVVVEYVRQSRGQAEVYLEALWLETQYRGDLFGWINEGDESEDLLLNDNIADRLFDDTDSDERLKVEEGEVIEFPYTDDNSGESLIIKTDRMIYPGLTEATSYFSVTNTSDKADTFELLVHFPESKGEVLSLKKRMKRIPYEVTVNEYGTVGYFCEGGWDGFEVQPEGDVPYMEYVCRDTAEIRTCDSLGEDGRNCVIEREITGSKTFVEYRDAWREAPFVREEQIAEDVTIFDRVLGVFSADIERKPMPAEFQMAATTIHEHRIEPGQTLYFEMDFGFPLNSQGEFYIEAIGSKHAYGLLDPWWNGSWLYRQEIVVDNTGSPVDLEDYQVYFELDGGWTDFWNDVQVDARDVRFVQESGSTEVWYQDGWQYRTRIAIDAAKVETDVSNFPVYVDLADLGGSFFTRINSDGGDIRVTTGDQITEVAREVVGVSASAEIGQLYFQAPSLSSTTDSIFYIYYGNASSSDYGATTTYGSENVWDANYRGVWHMEDTSITDASRYGYDATATANLTATSTGFGTSTDFNGASSYADLAANLGLTTAPFTVEYWVKYEGAARGCPLCKNDSGGANEFLIFYERNGGENNYDIYVENTNVMDNTNTFIDNGLWNHIVVSHDGSAMSVYQNGILRNQATTSSPTFDTTNRPWGMGMEWDGATRGDWHNGQIDETRISDSFRSRKWIATEYNNMATSSLFYSTSSAEAYDPLMAEELDFWISRWDYGSSTAEVWVQTLNLPAAATTSVYLYYGNVAAATSSDEYAPFTYDTLQDLYYVVRDDLTDVAVEAVSLIDNNIVQLDNGATTSLDRHETAVFYLPTASSTLRALGPVTAKLVGTTTTDGDSTDLLLPISFASTTFAIPSSRATESFHVYSPYSSSTVTVYDGAASPSAFSVATGSAFTLAKGVATMGLVESTAPILVAFDTNTPGDGLAVYPATTDDLYGIRSNSNFIGSTQNGTNFDISCSGGGSLSVTGQARGSNYTNGTCASAAQGAGDAVRLSNITQPIGSIQQADSDGNESTMYLPRVEFSTDYMIPTDSAYLAIVCAPEYGEVNVQVYDTGDVASGASGTCTPTATQPGKLLITANYGGGYSIASTDNPAKPFYAYYEDTEATGATGGDENNLFGAVQSRKWAPVAPTYATATAPEVSSDPQYSMNNFRFYANADVQTPTDPWPVGSEDLAENTAISGVDAIGNGQVIRMRTSILVENATSTASSTQFKLQYAEGETCSSGLTWQDVGGVGSGSIWRGYDNASVGDGSTLSSTTLSTSDVAATYEEANSSAPHPSEVGVNEEMEFDWVVENNSAPTNSTYCFRMVYSNGQILKAYNNYAQLVTNFAPNTPALLTLFDNEKTPDLTPSFTFVATDDSSDDIDYQIQIDDDYSFSSPVIDQNTIAHADEFEGVTFPADKAPYTAGTVVRYTVPTALASSTTFYWRVRGKDTNGSNQWGEWASPPSSFTTDTTVVASTWFQTTEEQFSSNTLVAGVTASTTDAVYDGGDIGEFATVTANDNEWQTVTLGRNYANLVVVATPRYSGDNDTQRTVRVRNKGSNTFEIKVDNHASTTPITGSTIIDYIAMEAGLWTMDDGGSGLQVIAGTEEVTGNTGNGCTTGSRASIAFASSFSGTPAMISTVVTENEALWVTSQIDDGATAGNPPSATNAGLWLQTVFAACDHTEPEDVDYIAFDQGHGTTTDGIVFDTQVGIATLDGAPEAPSPLATAFTDQFVSAPLVYLSGMLGMNGGNGGFSMTDTDIAVTRTNYYGSVDEDGPLADRNHTTEDVGVVAFSTATGTIRALANGKMISSSIDFDQGTVGNVWGAFSWNDNTFGATTTYQIEYLSGSQWTLIPNTEIPGNEFGIPSASSSVDLSKLDTSVYNTLRLIVDFQSTSTAPVLYDWTVSWKETVAKPTLTSPFDNEKVGTTSPSFTFYSTDPEGQDLEYEFSYSSNYDFSASTTVRSSAAGGFENIASSTDTNPFISGDEMRYTIPATLTNGETYWWKVRAKDPAGDNQWSFWSDSRSFTIDTAVTLSTWYQTDREQFDRDTLTGVETTLSDDVRIRTNIGEYGTVDVAAGTWITVNLTNTYNTPAVVTSVRYAPDAETQRAPRVRNKTSTSFEVLVDNFDANLSGTTTVDWIVMESGSWLIDDGGSGLKVIAGVKEDVSAVRFRPYGSTPGEPVSFTPAFDSAPVVMAQVSTDNDSGWVVATIDDGVSLLNEPSTTQLGLSLGRGYGNGSHQAEDIDYIAFDEGHGDNNNVEFDVTAYLASGTGLDCCSTTGDPVTFGTSYTSTSAPAVTVVTQHGTNGGDGSWMVQHTGAATPVSASTIYLSPDEDGPSLGTRTHTQESGGVVSFASSTGTIKRGGTAFVGTVDSQPVIFSEGNGPKWGDFSWTDNEVGTSTITYQALYLNASGTYALIPDSDLPNNSLGTSTSPIDLSGLNYLTYGNIKLRANFACSTAGDCPILEDWAVDWSEGLTVSGTIKQYDRATNVASGTIAVVVNGNGFLKRTGTITDGSWTVTNVTLFPDDIVHIYVDGTNDPYEAVAVSKYDRLLDMSGIELYERHIVIGSPDNVTITNADIGLWDRIDDEDVFFDINDSTGALTGCQAGGCDDVVLYVRADNTYRPSSGNNGDVVTHDVINNGQFIVDGNTIDVTGSWDNNGGFNAGSSQVRFLATSSTEKIDSTGAATSSFNNVQFGSSGAATWIASSTLDINGNTTISFGTLSMGLEESQLAGNFSIAATGVYATNGTTTFDGSATGFLTDNTDPKQDLGYVVVDGDSKTVRLQTPVELSSMTIGTDDTFDVSNSNHGVTVFGSWTNNNAFLARAGEVTFSSSVSDTSILAGDSPFYDVDFNGTGSWTFQDASAEVSNNFLITQGSVSLPTATTTIGGSLSNNDEFIHSIGTVLFDATDTGNTIAVGTSTFYNVTFNGPTGEWTFTESATTSKDFTITEGNVLLPVDTLAIGGSFDTSSNGSFGAGSGTVRFYNDIIESGTIRASGSSFNNLVFTSATTSDDVWYNPDWGYRVPVTIDSAEISSSLTNFPVYIDLSSLGPHFFNYVKSDGGDIRVTTDDKETEVARQVVTINTGAESGQLFFNAPTLASASDTTFYIYYGNAGASNYASSSTYGSQNVWRSEYDAVYHLEENASGVGNLNLYTDSTLNAYHSDDNIVSLGKSGQVGSGQEFNDVSNDYIDVPNAVLNGATDVSASFWMRTTKTGQQAIVSGAGSANDNEYLIFFSSNTALALYTGESGGSNVSFGISSISDNNWHHITMVRDDTNNQVRLYVDGQPDNENPQSTTLNSLTVDSGGLFLGQEQDSVGDCCNPAQAFDGFIDELRFYKGVLPAAWVSAEFTNHSSTTDFYSTSTHDSYTLHGWTFLDTNATSTGDVTMEGGTVVYPSGTFAAQGSFIATSTGLFIANGGEVRFAATSTGHLIESGTSTFAYVSFESATGGWTIVGNATSTEDWALRAVGDFVAPSGGFIEVGGSFTNIANGASTTWTGSTLALTSGTSYTVNTKTTTPEVYNTLYLDQDTHIRLWNSDATSFSVASTASIYSQDHAAADGELYIFGDYGRSSGTDYWSAATDFDGASLAGSPRPVTVSFASGATSTYNGGTLSIQGTSTATTTVTNQGAGNFAIVIDGASLDARYYAFRNMDVAGLQLLGNTSIVSLEDGDFEVVVSGGSGITIASSTINTNAALQPERIRFATTTAISATNVTEIGGTSTSYWWFKNGYGNLYGENFDSDPAGTPGDLRWDDSNFSIDISGIVYAAGGGGAGNPPCDGVSPVVRIVVDGGSSYTGACANGTGAYTISGVSFIGDVVLTTYLDTGPGGDHAVTVTKTPNADINDLNLWVDRLMLRHEDVAPITIADLTAYDSTDDTDVFMTAATGTPDTLVVDPGKELLVVAGYDFVPGGNITTQHAGSGNVWDGRVFLDNGASLTAAGTEAHVVGGSWRQDPASVFTAANSTVTFTATTTGQTIDPLSSFFDINFTGVGGGWVLGTNPLTITGDMSIATGTLSGTQNITIADGDVTGDGTIAMTGGIFTTSKGGYFGGATDWAFNDLFLGDGTVGSTTKIGIGAIDVGGVLTNGFNHTLNAGSSTWELSGGGTPFTGSGTFLVQDAFFRYTGTSATNIKVATYNDLELAPSGAGSPTYSIPAGTLSVRDLIVGDGTNAVIVSALVSDPVLVVNGDVLVNSSATLIASDSATLSVYGGWQNDGLFSASDGTVRFVATTTGHLIDAGVSPFAAITFDSPTGGWTISEHATSTGAWTLTDAANFTASSGVSVAVGGTFTNAVLGASTTWTGALLSLISGTSYSINDSSSSGDIYDMLRVASGTQARLWNSTSTTYLTVPGSSLYSQDHNGTDGSLYIFGDYINDSVADHWSHATDFDGVDISGSERPVTVRFASSSSATYTGGSLTVLGGPSASTTITNQGEGTYEVEINGGSINARYYIVRNIGPEGLKLSGATAVTTLRDGDYELAVPGGSLITVSGTTINANPLMTFRNNRFATSSGAITGFNVRATGGTFSSWRFALAYGGLDGEANDSDPGGDPGYIIWDDSAADITVAGTVYSDEGSATSTVCDGVTANVLLRVGDAESQSFTASTTCSAVDGSFSFSNVIFASGDVMTAYLNTGGGARAATVSVDPVSNIADFDLYEDRLIVRHEDINPISIANLAAYDSSNDTDLFFTAATGTPDTLSLPADTKLIVWTGKTFTPGGDMTLASGGTGSGHDGDIALYPNATLNAAGTQSYSIGGSWIASTSTSFIPANSTVTFTATTSGKSITTAGSPFAHVVFSGTGEWAFTETAATTSDFDISAGTVTLPSGTLEVAGSFDNSGGAFISNSGNVRLTSASTSVAVRTGGSSFHDLTFANAAGAWDMLDTNATTTGTTTIISGDVTLPSGVLAVGSSFTNTGGSFDANTGELLFIATSTGHIVSAGGSDFANLRFMGSGGSWDFQDVHATTTGDIIFTGGTTTLPTGTFAVGGSLTNTAAFEHPIGILRFDSADTGEVVAAGNSSFYGITFASPTGGWTISESATSTGAWRIKSAASYSVSAGATIAVGGVFENAVGGAATTWAAGSTLRLWSGTLFSINSKSAGGDVYDRIEIASSTQVRMWNSTSTTYAVDVSSSLYSQDHNAVDGDLYIWGDYHKTSGTDYWSYAFDFDGAVLAGAARRQVDVRIASGGTTTFDGGILNMKGGPSATTSVGVQGAGSYSAIFNGGTIDARYYEFLNLGSEGLQLLGNSTVTELSQGEFVVGVTGGTAITVASTTIENNPTKLFFTIGFATSTGVNSATNVTRVGTSSNSWSFNFQYGVIAGEAYDIDPPDNCGQIRWSDSTCLFISQEHFRWRYDDGGEGATSSEWFDPDWSKRKRIRVSNTAGASQTDLQVKVVIPYDADMQSDFDDLRFTDLSGTTTLQYWLESYTASGTSTAWVKVPSLPANGSTDLFVYYGNASVVTNGAGTSTFIAFDDFEDDDISEYSGDTSLFDTLTGVSYDGTYGLGAASGQTGAKTTDGIYRTDQTISQGETIRYWQYIDVSAGSDDEPCMLFGVQTPGSSNNNYAVCLDVYSTDQVIISRDVSSNETSGTPLATTTVSFSTGWYEVEIDWLTTDDINVAVFNSDGTSFATVSTNDSSYTSGGYGFSFWSQHGGWDTVSSREYVSSDPTVTLYGEGVNSGASWRAAEDTVTGVNASENVRARFSIVNSGAELPNQELRLQYAAKGVAANCEAVSPASFADVPTTTGGCGTSPACMTSSTEFTNRAATTPLLTPPDDISVSYTAGEIMEDPSNETTSLTMGANTFSDVEYNFQMTAYAVSPRYCFRVSDGGVSLDNYDRVAELVIALPPSISDFSFNNNQSIALIEGTTRTVYATATVTDLSGWTDIAYATATIYRSDLGAGCASNDNNCYQLASTSCSFSNCAGNTCDLSCGADIYYHADPTDGGTYAAEEWQAVITVADSIGLTDTETPIGEELLTLRALEVAEAINYGVINLGSDTGNKNSTTTLYNTGNIPIDVEVAGTDMVNGGSSIDVTEQAYATSTFTYGVCAICQFLSGTSTAFEVDLPKPTSTTTPVNDEVYWGLNVPTGIAGTTHTGSNTFTAVDD